MMKARIGLPNTLAHEVDLKLGELHADVVVRDPRAQCRPHAVSNRAWKNGGV